MKFNLFYFCFLCQHFACWSDKNTIIMMSTCKYAHGIQGLKLKDLKSQQVIKIFALACSDSAPVFCCFQYVFITGGCASFGGFKERLEHELLAMRPFQSKFSVSQAANPTMDAWSGARQWALQPALLSQYGLTKRDYEEKGGEYLKEHSVTNCYFATPPAPPAPVVVVKDEKVAQ